MSAIAELPKFETFDELVAFWDIHDFTNYLDEMEEMDLETGLPGHTPESLRIRLDKVLMQQLREIAAERGLCIPAGWFGCGWKNSFCRKLDAKGRRNTLEREV